MVYRCAYFEHSAMTLEQAQLAKMNHVCRKLRLQRGMTVVDAGCGWGALAIHMARHYAVHVKAYNISGEQIEYAPRRGQAAEFGKSSRIRPRRLAQHVGHMRCICLGRYA